MCSKCVVVLSFTSSVTDFVAQAPSLTSEHQLGMSDLLPPSPSAVMYNPRNFAPSSSLLSSSVMSASPMDISQHSAFKDAGASFLGIPRSNSPVSSDAPSAESQSRSNSNDMPTPLFSAAAPNLSLGPAIRPLDFGAMMLSHEVTHSEVARTVDDLMQWLSVVEVGLIGMLDKVYEDTIEEEQEDAAAAGGEESEHDEHGEYLGEGLIAGERTMGLAVNI